MAITDGKCCGIIHVQERRQSRRRGRGWVGSRGGTTSEHCDGGVKENLGMGVMRGLGAFGRYVGRKRGKKKKTTAGSKCGPHVNDLEAVKPGEIVRQ